MPSTRGWCNRLEAMMLREEYYGRHVSDDGLEKSLNDYGRSAKCTDDLERQNAELLARNDLLEEEIRQLRKAFAPRLLFPLSWHLNRGETSVLACLYVSPDGFDRPPCSARAPKLSPPIATEPRSCRLEFSIYETSCGPSAFGS